MKLYRILMAVLTGMWVLGGTALAHRQPEVMTTVVYTEADEGGAVTQITHRLHAHDALQLLGGLPGVTRANLDDRDNLARLAAYTAERFKIDGAEMIGAEVDGNYLFVYEQAVGHPKVAGSWILADLNDHWVNFVEITLPDGTHQSLLFSKSVGKTLEQITENGGVSALPAKTAPSPAH